MLDDPVRHRDGYLAVPDQDLLTFARGVTVGVGSGCVPSGARSVNKLYFGDNLDVLREHVQPESVDLIYLDPPFNSNATYNVLFKTPAGRWPKPKPGVSRHLGMGRQRSQCL